MPETVIRADGISKRYRLGASYGYQTVRESLAGAARRAVFRNPSHSEPSRSLWALRDVSFEIRSGDVVGLIGLNGAGKTTILKILARITKPTSGRAFVHGRVGSLLEVGTGFHPELTGRENVFLNGAILGMTKRDIARRFDEIVAFADISEFLDTPVKRYSSGMKVRLAFSVAAHLEPEILIVDEVLAVGDVAFQKKCLGKMGDVTSEGRTILFVSHNMSLIRALCRRGILLSGGEILADSQIEDAISFYLRRLEEAGSQDLLLRTDRRGWQRIKLSRIDVTGDDVAGGRLMTGGRARFSFHVTDILPRTTCMFTIQSEIGQPVAQFSSAPAISDDEDDAQLRNVFVCMIDELLLIPGRYRVDVKLRGNGHTQDQLEAAAFFDVEEGVVRGRPLSAGTSAGVVSLPHVWRYPTSP